jgi:iron-sulfur cluster assembly protein
MIQITPSAVRKVKKLLIDRGTPHLGLRLAIRGGGCSGLSYFMDFTERAEATDQVFDFDGLAVFVDPKSLAVLDGTELDYGEGITNHGFHFNNPKAKSSCGCGTSFSV